MKKQRNPVHGWLILDKPHGMTSTQAVGKVRWLFNAEKAGHGGTLDPLASGLLPIALGEATKTVSHAMDGRKVYRFTAAADDILGHGATAVIARSGLAVAGLHVRVVVQVERSVATGRDPARSPTVDLAVPVPAPAGRGFQQARRTPADARADGTADQHSGP